MATFRPSSRLLLKMTARKTTAGAGVPRPGPGALQALAIHGRSLLGAALLLLGILLVFTLWLLPLGLPTALVGVALLLAPDNRN